MPIKKNHITICFCTYKRAKRLDQLTKALQAQTTENLFELDIVAIDNDFKKSAEAIIEDIRRQSYVSISYFNEPEQNIALARNRAVENAKGDFVAFIDDDEIPCRKWLINLYKACNDFHADGVLGPVVPYYEVDAPKWVVQGKFHERPNHRTGEVLHWKNTRTGNVLFRKSIFDDEEGHFRRRFGRGGEDTDFFKRMIKKGSRFVWCAEAPVYEAVTAERCTRSFLLKRALARGRQPYFAAADYARSIIAIPLYTMALPFLLAGGHHLFMKYLIKNCDHIGRLCALCRIDLIKERYPSNS